MDVNIGELNKRISILANTTIQDTDGFETEQEVIVCTIWAKVSNISGTEVFKAGADYSTVKTRFLVRYRKDIEFNTDMKIKFNSKTYNIIYANEYNFSHEFVELVAEVVE